MRPSKKYDPELGRFLFRFVALADTHITAVEGESPSPWPTNRQANARARAAVREINALAPNMVIHMGDMVHPVPAQDSYSEAAERAKEIFADLQAPLHYVPGNHDMGDKHVEWMPAEVVNEEFAQAYRRHFGPDFYAFDHLGCRFLVLNAQILNSGLESEERQWDWLERELRAGPVRRFIFMHYPLYIADADEREHYDNVGEPARARLLNLVRGSETEILLGAHVHNFFCDRIGDASYYVMPAVSAIRHDYSEMFRIAPSDSEFGRNDNAKLGFMAFDVYEGGHVPHYIRSHGATAEPSSANADTGYVRPVTNSRLGGGAALGVDLRASWGKAQDIPYAGGVDEFYRKRARNDYLAVALWETGIRRLRIPADDLLDSEVRQRMRMMRAVGHEFTLFTYGPPDGQLVAALEANPDLLSGIEVIARWPLCREALDHLGLLRERSGVPVFLSKLRSSAEAEVTGAKYTHFIVHGLSPDDLSEADACLSAPGGDRIDGVSFRVASGSDPAAAIAAAQDWAEETGKRALVHVTLADENPAIMPAEDAAFENRVAGAAFAAMAAAERCHVLLDTFADMDRGYFPRLGLVDRRCNPRDAARMVARIAALMPPARWRFEAIEQSEDGMSITVKSGAQTLRLLLAARPTPASRFGCGDGEARLVDLATGAELGSTAFAVVERPTLAFMANSAASDTRTELFQDA